MHQFGGGVQRGHEPSSHCFGGDECIGHLPVGRQ
ncbi:hypothetical protein RHRU231_210007 [Rhodococcus ruber]|uniref:Uncharacterized protein n=1 Tax=Rhodococcus ruber TaxID=1830 RepID=A0A098BHA0_9NOCA|nr:hypothetical protein RHRU231_210007 [Rhodococcus ruber]